MNCIFGCKHYKIHLLRNAVIGDMVIRNRIAIVPVRESDWKMEHSMPLREATIWKLIKTLKKMDELEISHSEEEVECIFSCDHYQLRFARKKPSVEHEACNFFDFAPIEDLLKTHPMLMPKMETSNLISVLNMMLEIEANKREPIRLTQDEYKDYKFPCGMTDSELIDLRKTTDRNPCSTCDKMKECKYLDFILTDNVDDDNSGLTESYLEDGDD